MVAEYRKPSVKLLAEAWADFEGKVIPSNAGERQRKCMKDAFYAGAWAILCFAKEMGEPDVPEDLGIAVMESLDSECQQFFDLKENP